jgi:ABC-2 type transport system permease protein
MRALHAEWTKLRTLPSTAWLLLTVVLGTAGTALLFTGTRSYRHCEDPCTLDATRISLGGVRLGQLGIVILAVLAVTAEYSTRTMGPTLTAEPRRWRVVLGKLVALAALGLGAGVVAVGGSLAAGRVLLPSHGFTGAHGFPPLSLDDALTRRAAIGTVLYLVLLAMLGAGLGLLLRDTAGAITAALALLYASPVVALFIKSPHWSNRVHRYSPMDAGLSIQATRDFAAEHIGPWAGLGILAAWAGAAVLGGLIAFQLRDSR